MCKADQSQSTQRGSKSRSRGLGLSWTLRHSLPFSQYLTSMTRYKQI
jgi:hypothetical protein